MNQKVKILVTILSVFLTACTNTDTDDRWGSFSTDSWTGCLERTTVKPADAKQHIRLSLWSKGRNTDDKPDVCLFGVDIQMGTCGAGDYIFPDSGYSLDSASIKAYVLSYTCLADEEPMELSYFTDLPIRHISDSVYCIDDTKVEDVENLPWTEVWREQVKK